MKKLLTLLITLSVLAFSGCGALAPPEQTPEQTPIPDYSFSRADFPTLAAGLTTEPLTTAVASIMLGESRDDVSDLVLAGSTTDAWLALQDGSAGLVIAAESESMPSEAETVQVARDGLVFFTGEGNSVDSLTTAQLKKIFSGDITNWKELGGKDEAIGIIAKSDGSGSLAALERLLAVSSIELDGADFDTSSGALGFAFYHGAENMGLASGMKILAVDGVRPSIETIASGDYALVCSYFAAISSAAPESSPERALFQWLQSDIGQAFVSAQGYVR